MAGIISSFRPTRCSMVSRTSIPDEHHLRQVTVIQIDLVEHPNDRQADSHPQLGQHREWLSLLVCPWHKGSPDKFMEASTGTQSQAIARVQAQTVLPTLRFVGTHGPRQPAPMR